MTGHTPGPWRHATTGNIGNLIEAQSGRKTYEHDDGWRGVATVQHCCSSDKYLEQQQNQAANIRLIAAAPDMLAALREVEWIFDGQEDITDTGAPNDAMKALAILRAAITKATGAA